MKCKGFFHKIITNTKTGKINRKKIPCDRIAEKNSKYCFFHQKD